MVVVLAGALSPSRIAASTDFWLAFNFPPAGSPWSGIRAAYHSFLVEDPGTFTLETPVSEWFNGFVMPQYWTFTQGPGNLGDAIARGCLGGCYPYGYDPDLPSFGGVQGSLALDVGFYTIVASGLIDPFSYSEASARAFTGEVPCDNRFPPGVLPPNNADCGFRMRITSADGVAVPEPSPLLLLATGLLAVSLMRKRRTD